MKINLQIAIRAYINRLIKLVNRKNQQKCSLIFDELPTVFLKGIVSLIATARSNKVATCLGMQDFSQFRKDYGGDQAAVIMNIVGNIISGQVMGETAKFLAERFSRIVQVKESISINRSEATGHISPVINSYSHCAVSFHDGIRLKVAIG